MINVFTEVPKRKTDLLVKPTPGCDGDCCDDGACALPVQKMAATPSRKIRSGVMFAVACVFSPCCTPLLVPIVIALLAGTPLAAWIGANLGWVYGGLTGIAVISLALGLYGLRQQSTRQRHSSNAALEGTSPQ